MKRLLLSALFVLLALPGCGRNENVAKEGVSSGGSDTASTIAYGFTYRFALPGAAVGQVQDAHIALCDQLGPERCRLQEMHCSVGPTDYGGSLRLAVARDDAPRFGQALVAPVTRAGGELKSRDFEAEDLSGQRTEAQDKVAEKNDAANRAALSGVRDRLLMSSIWIYYEGTASFGKRIGDAFGAAGETVTSSVVALIYFVAGALPWIIVFGLIFFVGQAILRQARRRLRGGTAVPPVSDGSA